MERNTVLVIHSFGCSINMYQLYKRHYGQQEKDRYNFHCGIYSLGKPILSSAWRETQSLGVSGKGRRGHTDHPGQPGGRLQEASEVKAKDRASKTINERQSLPTRFGGRQAIIAVRFQFFSYSQSKLEFVDKCLSLNHPPATGNSNYWELPHSSWRYCRANINNSNKLRGVSLFIFLFLLFYFFFLR